MAEPNPSKPALYSDLPTNEGHWTRLLLLKGGESHDPIECLLEPYDLDTLQYSNEDEKLLPYEALSYVWGPRTSLRSITVNSVPMQVTPNLHDALVAIRVPGAARSLWVDAICINQDDLAERNHQVALMASIYRQAARVLIWLGHGDAQYAEPAFRYLCQRANKVYLDFGWTRQLFKIRLASFTIRGEEVPSSELQVEDVRPNARQFEAFAAFVRQPWFFRVWIVQEVSLARHATVFWHEASIDLGFVMVALDEWRQDSRGFAPPVGLDNVGTIRFNRKVEHKGVQFPFSRRMYDLRDFDCFDPRDRVYGLLGLNSVGTDPENDVLFIKPDYSLPVEVLYEQVARKMLIDQKQVYLLSAVYHDREIAGGLPSWVPDWRRPAPALDTFTISGEGFGSTGPITDEYGVDVSLTKKNGKEYLRVAGYEIAAISSVTPVLRASDITDRFSKEDSAPLKEALKDICDTFDQYSILQAMIRNREQPQKLLASYPETLFGYRDLYSFLTDPATPVDTHDFEGYEDLVEQFRSALANLCDGRRLFGFYDTDFSSKDGHLLEHRIGSGPELVREGDIVCMLFGGFDFYLLRIEADGYQRFLGTCDLDGENVERSVARPQGSGKPTHHFEIF